MGKASSSKKVARAAKVANRPGAKRSYAWPLAIGAVILVGVLLVVLSFGGGGSSDLVPRVGDHWHAAYGIYDCDNFLAPLTDLGADVHGIHTHGDGLMHIHPFDSSVSGKKAAIAALGADTGLQITDTSFNDTEAKVSRKTGDTCGSGKTGTVKLFVWDSLAVKTPRVITKDIAKYSPRKDQTVWVLAFVPAGTTPPLPSSVANLQNPVDAAPSSSTPASTDTTAPASGTATTATTAPASGSATTATTAKP
jgi:hypothetical protein